jgi:hypothetical protein
LEEKSKLKKIVIIALSDVTENVTGIIEALKKHGYDCCSYENNLGMIPLGSDYLVVSRETHIVNDLDNFIEGVSKVLVFASPNLGDALHAQILMSCASFKGKLAPIIICDYSVTLHNLELKEPMADLDLDKDPDKQINQILSVL